MPNAMHLPNGRWQPLEIVFWLIPVASFFLFPGYLVLISQIMIVGLFAISLDLILGYAGRRRMPSGEKDGMARAGFRKRMFVKCVLEKYSFAL